PAGIPEDMVRARLPRPDAEADPDAAALDRAGWAYRFLEPATHGGRPIDWQRTFALLAVPGSYGDSGIYTLLVTTDGAVYVKDVGEAPPADIPADPAAAGWTRMEPRRIPLQGAEE
ncbi:MAG: DUF2950 family protein, partial [Planctomycetota bacterium]